MRLAVKAWAVIPLGLILVAVAGIAAVGFAPRSTRALPPMVLHQVSLDESVKAGSIVPQSAVVGMPVSAGLVYEEAASERDPVKRTDALLNAIMREVGKK